MSAFLVILVPILLTLFLLWMDRLELRILRPAQAAKSVATGTESNPTGGAEGGSKRPK